MMVVTHGLSAYVSGRLAMPALRRVSPLTPRVMSLAFFLGATMPDGDILSRILLGSSGYFSGAWYGHRQASHSILGTFLLAGVVALAGFAPLLRPRGPQPAHARPRAAVRHARRAPSWRKRVAWAWGCLWCGGLLHLVGDLPTPGMSLPVLWPLDLRFGSWSHIGWFTPYLWWMFVAAVALAAALRWAGAWLVARGAFRTGIYIAGSAWAVYALALYRWLHYLAVSRYESAASYAAGQRALLPEPLASVSTEWVRALWRWMVN